MKWISLIVILALPGCKLVGATGRAVAECSARVLGEVEAAGVAQLQDPVDAALRLDWHTAEGLLLDLSAKYGGDLVRCVVDVLRAQYAALLLSDPATGPVTGPVATSVARRAVHSGPEATAAAYGNARAWLTRGADQPSAAP